MDNEKTVDSSMEEDLAEEIKEEENVEDKKSSSDKKKAKKAEAELQKKLEEKNAELAEEKDKYTRLFAEYDNFRKRTAKEKEGIYADAYIDALSQILPVLDNLERAAAFENADAEALRKGL